MDVGTAKVKPQERLLVPHLLLDIAAPNEIYTVSQYQQQAVEAIDDILARGYLPFLVGGSPHYIQAAVDHLYLPRVPPDYALRAQLETRPLPALGAALDGIDPPRACTIADSNP